MVLAGGGKSIPAAWWLGVELFEHRAARHERYTAVDEEVRAAMMCAGTDMRRR